MDTMADSTSVSPEIDKQIELCELLGIDPTQATGLRIEIDPGQRPYVEWTSVRRLTSTEVDKLLDVFRREAPEPPC